MRRLKHRFNFASLPQGSWPRDPLRRAYPQGFAVDSHVKIGSHSQCSCRKICSDCSPEAVTATANDEADEVASIVLNEAIRVNHQLTESIDWSAQQLESKDAEIERLKSELRQATASLETMALEAATGKRPVIDLGHESPLNLFIQCFKEKYDVCVNPNDVAIFV